MAGLHYNYFRDYESITGRYVEGDPIGLDGGINTHAYVELSPLGDIDPTGERRSRAGRASAIDGIRNDPKTSRCVKGWFQQVEALATLADQLIARRISPHHNEVLDFDFSSIPGQSGLAAFLACHEYWCTDGLEEIPGPVTTYIFELFALRATEARLAEKDIEEFSEQMEACAIEPEDILRRTGL